MNIVHLTASRFFGGPERQMLGLACALPSTHRTIFLSFPEGGHSQEFLDEVRSAGFDGAALRSDFPRFGAVLRELIGFLRGCGATVLCCHGYKADLFGLLAARRLGIPAVGVSRGWTTENRRVRLYEAIDRRVLRWMDRVVCVSEGQAEKVRHSGVNPAKISVIHNAIRTDRFTKPSPEVRASLTRLFPQPPRLLVGAAGRLSPEKGFDVLVAAAASLVRAVPEAGFVLFGEGARRQALTEQVRAAGLAEHFVLPGFRRDLDELLPAFDVFALPSHTEGLPNVVLESFAAGVPVVATAVGGTPELVEDGVSGRLVPPGDARAGQWVALAAQQRERPSLCGGGGTSARADRLYVRGTERTVSTIVSPIAGRACRAPEKQAPAEGRVKCGKRRRTTDRDLARPRAIVLLHRSDPGLLPDRSAQQGRHRVAVAGPDPSSGPLQGPAVPVPAGRRGRCDAPLWSRAIVLCFVSASARCIICAPRGRRPALYASCGRRPLTCCRSIFRTAPGSACRWRGWPGSAAWSARASTLVIR